MSRLSTVTAALVVSIGLMLPGGANAKGKKKKAKGTTLAISYFDNNSNDTELDALKKGLADMLITDLSGMPGLNLVERSRLEDILKELKLSKSRVVDKKSAVKMGKLLAAQYLMVGGYTVSGKKMRIDARLLKVGTGKVVIAHKVNGNKDDFFAMEKELAEFVIDTLKLQLTFKDKTKLRRNQTQSYTAFLAYSQGLDAKDRGKYDKAKALFQRALDADPNYKAAKTARGKLDVVLDKHTDARREGAAKLLGKLDPKSKTFATDYSMLMMRLDDSDPASYKRKLKLIITLIKTNQLPLQKTNMGMTSPLVDSVLRIMAFYVGDPASDSLIFGACEWAIKTAPGSHVAGSMCKSYRLQIDMMKKHTTPDQRVKDRASAKKNAIAPMKAKWTYEALGRKLLALCAKKARK